ncbi:MAG: RidA family protein [Reyranella sp.]|nr:RidA family protein [Reyranella sp.]
MAIKFHNPKSVALTGKYSLGVEVPSDARLLFLAGQVGYDAKGRLVPGIEKQCELTWKNIGNILKSAGMGYGNIVRATGFITDSRFIAPYREARAKFLKSPYPAATLIVVSGLADPGMFVEIEVVAAK